MRQAPNNKRLEFLSDEIQSWYPDLAANATALAVGDIYTVQVGEKAVVKSWKSLAAVSKAVGGARAFQKLVTVTFKALAGVIGNTAAEALQTEPQTGLRNRILPFDIGSAHVTIQHNQGTGAPAVPAMRRTRGQLNTIPIVIEQAIELPKAA